MSVSSEVKASEREQMPIFLAIWPGSSRARMSRRPESRPLRSCSNQDNWRSNGA
jgi:hypothetical protein